MVFEPYEEEEVEDYTPKYVCKSKDPPGVAFVLQQRYFLF